MTLDFKNSIFFGQPLNDAYSVHSELGFYGVIVHGSADRLLKKSENSHVFEYNCPIKGGIAKHLTILPEYLEIYLISNDVFQGYYTSTQDLRVSTSGSLRTYIDKTLEYFDFFKGQCKKIVE